MKKIIVATLILCTNNILGQRMLENHWNERFDQIKSLYQNYEMEPIDGFEIFISDSISTIHYGSLTIKNKSGTTWIETTINKKERDILSEAENAYIMATSRLFRSLKPKVKKKIKKQTGDTYTNVSFFLFHTLLNQMLPP